jgi:hypothetical protein
MIPDGFHRVIGMVGGRWLHHSTRNSITAPLLDLVEVAAVGIVPVVGLFVRWGNFDIKSFLEHRRSEIFGQLLKLAR